MKLVNLANYGIRGMNYYWNRREMFNLSEEELGSVGVIGNEALVDEAIIQPLKKANEILKEQGYELLVKDAYRTPALYALVQEKRYAVDGKENTDKTLNAIDRPHASGRTVDVTLVSLKDGTEVEMWDKKDWPDGAFVDFCKNKEGERSQEFQGLQELLIDTMLKAGFKLGIKKEFWHFELKK